MATIQQLLAANSAISQFLLMPGPEGTESTVGVCEAEITAIPADAYVVPHFREDDRRIGISWEVERAGAKPGLDAYDAILAERNDERPGWGEVVVTPSGGGLAANLLHVVCLCSGIGKEEGMVIYSVISALHMAHQHAFQRVIVPPLGTGVLGVLRAEQSAKLMFDTTFECLRKYAGSCPSECLVAVGREGDLYETFAKVLRGSVVAERRNGKAAAPSRDRPSDRPPAAKEALEDKLRLLSDLELASLTLALWRNGKGFRQHCIAHPWYEKMESFFLPDGSLDEGTAAEVREEANRRTR